MRSDNGPEFVSLAMLRWIAGADIVTVLNEPGKPWQNGADDSFNGKSRDEFLSVEWFRSRLEATVVIETWRQHYNGVRPHSSLQYLTPTEFKQQLRQGMQPPSSRNYCLGIPESATSTTMIFSRRALQRRLDEVRDVLGPELSSKLANRLNRPHKDRMAAMWELVVLHGLSKCGSLTSELALNTGKRPDIHLTCGALQMTADVTSVSDDGLDEDNPIRDFVEALEAAKKKLNLPIGGIDLRVHDKQVRTARGTKTVLKLPRRQELREYVQNAIAPKLSEQVATGVSPFRLDINDDEVGFDLLIDPTKPGSVTYGHASYSTPRIKDVNPLYAALKKKANQLRNAEGLRGIIVGDGGCRAITANTRNWDGVTTHQILVEFFRQYQSIDFVVVLTVPERNFTGVFPQLPPLKIDSKIFHREDLRAGSDLKALFDAALAHFPKPAMTPINGALRAREPGYDLGHHGGYTLAESTIRMSLREFTEIFAGLRTLNDNGARNVEAARRLETEPSPLARVVLHHVLAGRLPDNIEIIQTDEDDNDNWIEIHFGRIDPAIAPLK